MARAHGLATPKGPPAWSPGEVMDAAFEPLWSEAFYIITENRLVEM